MTKVVLAHDERNAVWLMRVNKTCPRMLLSHFLIREGFKAICDVVVQVVDTPCDVVFGQYASESEFRRQDLSRMDPGSK
jgi:hypothetical protein